jgi:hypothetical protein
VHPLIDHGGPFADGESQDIAVHPERLFHVANGNGNVMNPSEHGGSRTIQAAGKPDTQPCSVRNLAGTWRTCQAKVHIGNGSPRVSQVTSRDAGRGRYIHSCLFA